MNVLLSATVTPEERGWLASQFPKLQFIPMQPGETPDDATLQQIDIFFRDRLSAALFQDLISRSPKLRWVHTASAGVDMVLVPPLIQREIILTRSPVYATPIAEFVLTMMLAMAHRLPTLFQSQYAHAWRPVPPGELAGATVGIVGVGSIGGGVARMAKSLEMRVIGIRRSAEPAPNVDQMLTPSQLPELLAAADYVVLALPLLGETRHLIGQAELQRMRSDAVLINIARGGLVDEPALVQALQTGQIGGAALDTFAVEPLPPGSPLWTLPNVIISPHNSGQTVQVRQRTFEFFADNLRRFLAGEPMLGLVNKKLGY